MFKDKIMIVTGGCSGIGWGITKMAAQRGATVIAGQRSVASGQERIDSLVADGLDAHFLQLDVADPDRVETFVNEVHDRFGRIDVLINNAGITIEEEFFDMPLEKLDMLWNVNVRSIFLMSQYTARHMVADEVKGSIVNVSSAHSRASCPMYEMYAGTKGAISAMTRAMAWSLGSKGIRVNTCSPGLTMTEDVQKIADEDPRLAQSFREISATKDVASVKDIAEVVLFMASDAAAAVTGAEYYADKGLSSLLVPQDSLL
ncbi:SDR family NAD(P)-dependent oxidoreductase [Erythrobacter sp. W53]|uniref:SDR family NAD(P)-dependent oxidoreductase n=1 Tax=Erythrobacter sp. W53 TaxID=3425947 RepID=UPI003D768679